MRKQILTITFLLFCIQGVRSQALHQKIKGVLLQENNFKYAYLQDNLDSMPLLATVVNNRFEFTVDKSEVSDLRTLSLTIDSIDRKAFVFEKKSFSSRNSRLIAMGDLTIEIGSDLPSANVKGGTPNVEVDEMFKTLISKDFTKFFKEHSDSQISLTLLSSLISLNKISSDFNYQCSTYFNALTERLKKTPEGGKVREKLNN